MGLKASVSALSAVLLCVAAVLSIYLVSAETVVVAQAEQYWSLITADDTQVYSISNPDIVISEVEFTLSSAATQARLAVEVLNEVPEHLAPSDSETYSVMKVLATNIDQDRIKGTVKVRFKVDKEWMKDNGIGVSSVHLKRYKSGTWVILPTRKLSEGFSSVFYEAETPGFSYFVIAGVKSETPAPAPVAAPEPEPEPVAEAPAPEPVETHEEATPPVQQSADVIAVEKESLFDMKVSFDWLTDSVAMAKDYPTVPYVAGAVVLALLLMILIVHFTHHHPAPMPMAPMAEPPMPGSSFASPAPETAPPHGVTFLGEEPEPAQVELEEAAPVVEPSEVVPEQPEAAPEPKPVKKAMPKKMPAAAPKRPAVAEEPPEPSIAETQISELMNNVRRMLAQGRVQEAKKAYLEGKEVYHGMKMRGEATFDLYDDMKELHDEIQEKLGKAS